MQRTIDNATTRRADAGMTLIELMVALAIGAFLMIGAITVFMQGRTTFRITESVSRLQENGRFAIDALEPDVRMARFWGLTTRTTRIANRAAPTDPNGIGVDSCGQNWLINLKAAVEVRNNSYAFPACAPTTGAAMPNSDTLVVRRVAEDIATLPLVANRMYVQSARFQDSRIFDNAVLPAGFTAGDGSETHQLVVHGYFVSTASSLGAFPSLRRKTLRDTGAIQEEEVLPGVEDMQIELGVDTDIVGAPNRGSIDRYVDANDPILDPMDASFLPDAEILAVRIWLRIRAERTENGFTDTATYQYADTNVGPFNDAFRRIVVSKTIYLRNARPAT